MKKEPIKVLARLQFNPRITILKEAKKLVFIDTQDSIPFLVWLLENPQSPIPLPGNINLENHDCLHAIFGLSNSVVEEAFLIGLTMGSDTKLKKWHVKLFKFISQFLYPEKFRFCQEHFFLFDLGVECGRKLKVKNLNKIDFSLYEDKTIAELRDWLDVHDVLLLINTDLSEAKEECFSQQYSFV